MLSTGNDNALEDIIKGCINNDRKSQKILYDQYFERLLMHCRSYSLPEEDSISIINNTMLKVFQKIGTFSQFGSFSSWVHMIHKRNIIDHFRKNNKHKMQSIEDSMISLPTHDHHKSDVDHIFSAIEYLPQKIKTVLTLYALEGYSHKEIAQHLEISEGTSRWYLNQARQMMNQKLGNHG